MYIDFATDLPSAEIKSVSIAGHKFVPEQLREASKEAIVRFTMAPDQGFVVYPTATNGEFILGAVDLAKWLMNTEYSSKVWRKAFTRAIMDAIAYRGV